MLADVLTPEPNVRSCVQVQIYCTVCVRANVGEGVCECVCVCANVHVFKAERVCGRLNAE